MYIRKVAISLLWALLVSPTLLGPWAISAQSPTPSFDVIQQAVVDYAVYRRIGVPPNGWTQQRWNEYIRAKFDSYSSDGTMDQLLTKRGIDPASVPIVDEPTQTQPPHSEHLQPPIKNRKKIQENNSNNFDETAERSLLPAEKDHARETTHASGASALKSLHLLEDTPFSTLPKLGLQKDLSSTLDVLGRTENEKISTVLDQIKALTPALKLFKRTKDIRTLAPQLPKIKKLLAQSAEELPPPIRKRIEKVVAKLQTKAALPKSKISDSVTLSPIAFEDEKVANDEFWTTSEEKTKSAEPALTQPKRKIKSYQEGKLGTEVALAPTNPGSSGNGYGNLPSQVFNAGVITISKAKPKSKPPINEKARVTEFFSKFLNAFSENDRQPAGIQKSKRFVRVGRGGTLSLPDFASPPTEPAVESTYPMYLLSLLALGIGTMVILLWKSLRAESREGRGQTTKRGAKENETALH